MIQITIDTGVPYFDMMIIVISSILLLTLLGLMYHLGRYFERSKLLGNVK